MLDEKGNPQDASLKGDSSDGGTGTSENQDLHQAQIEKAVSDALSKQGRVHAEALKQVQSRQDQKELDGLKDDPDEYKRVKGLQDGRRQADEASLSMAEAEETKRQAKETLSKAEGILTKIKADEIASRDGLDADTLLKLSDGKVEKMEELAKHLSKDGAKTRPPSFKPDGGETTGGSGGGKKPSLEELRASDPMETEKKVASGEWKL